MTTAVDAADSSRHEDVERTEILIIGAGPAGSVAAAMLRQQGRKVLMLERQQFPRFSIGESLLPQSMEYIEAAGLLQDVVEAGFQYKNGAAFVHGKARTAFDFRKKFSPGWGTTYQVQRADFDNVLARGAERMGATLRFGDEVLSVEPGEQPLVSVRRPDGSEYRIEADFILDASGFARLLPRLLDLESPSNFPVRGAIFCHVRDNIPAEAEFDRNKILITTHPEHIDVWYWTIPFSNGCCSLGVVAEPSFFERYEGDDLQKLQAIVGEDPNLTSLLANAEWAVLPVRRITGYSANVSSLWGPGYALLGNAGEFLDPVFSSGVTIAFKSAQLASECLKRRYAGETVDWESEFSIPLRAGVKTFRRFVESWYQGGFQKIIYHPDQQPQVRDMISSILAGYAWDTNNPYVADDSGRRMRVLEELCSA
ncbi:MULTISPECIES: NAD(P)/FAD-dependent oxidoreductase [Stenotrophomonas]|uniref:NAD(P)/FAD-dependent oxidoreductase n=1 Tax=Stenotrophomonas indicatrix TaxID=2045451 RepID=A0ABT8QF88_9GAMM|nr:MULTISPECIES: NAD(P)/FAD-dependent oxidoreductase [Stenotrophomonas]OJH81454.1 MAG: FAD-dependent oxidoreductase [Stenotrophomonas maltophilia]MBO1746365.1 tryptophan 7-halogenase [Stenotrophomonas indicatrix]MDF2480601.1 FAD-dependent oxidoreductase [Stenotrophomonas indicatrix]MDH6331446.1 flavin-dependent dehydrogenase [Stenotrophomonas sp. 1278]MDN8644464.1 NAD(P)/FAD-dependent oxidoreductase [Stenotrophomonas indicatrix]